MGRIVQAMARFVYRIFRSGLRKWLEINARKFTGCEQCERFTAELPEVAGKNGHL
jgi:hypothetical protein